MVTPLLLGIGHIEVCEGNLLGMHENDIVDGCQARNMSDDPLHHLAIPNSL